MGKGMKLKLDEKGAVVLKDGLPVWVTDDGKEVAYDVPQMVADASRNTGALEALRKENAALGDKLKAYDGLEPDRARSALDMVSNLDAGKLLDAGKVEELKAQVARSWESKVAELEKGLNAVRADADAELKAKDDAIRRLMVRGIFESSQFLKDKTVLTPDIAFDSFGKYFEVKEQNGELGVVAMYQGQPVYSRAKPGTLALPEEALETLIEEYPLKDRILRPVQGGADSRRSETHTGGGKVIPHGDMKAFGANLEAIAKGEVTVA